LKIRLPRDPRRLPSAERPRHARAVPPLECGHVSFRCDEGPSVSSHAASYLRTLGDALGARPWPLPNRVRWRCDRFSAPGHCPSTSATTSSTTREHDLERPILARSGGRAFPPAPMRCPSLPVRAFRRARLATVPPLPRGNGQRAVCAPPTPSPTRTSQARGGAPEAAAPRSTACEAAPRAHRRLHRGWMRQRQRVDTGRPARSEGTRPPSRADREGRYEVSLLRSESSTPCVVERALFPGRLIPLPHGAPT